MEQRKIIAKHISATDKLRLKSTQGPASHAQNLFNLNDASTRSGWGKDAKISFKLIANLLLNILKWHAKHNGTNERKGK